uniref:Odorant receptor n=1 Tax=Eucryptorrhynchus scrobiculatus TaxID=1552824 RepID=A0A8F4MZG6_EUCSC|nr:odorant receptor 41 [Eucryptorrhynchus scrobiculatus]
MMSEDYFYWHYKILKFFLIIPPKRWILKVPFWIISVPHLVLICLSAFLETTQLCLGGSGEFSSDILNLGISVLHFMGVNRVASWHFVRKDIDAVVEGVRKINLNFSDFDCPNEGSARTGIQSNSNPIDEYRAQKLHQTKRFCLTMISIFLSYVVLNISTSYILNHREPTYQKWNPRLNRSSTYRDYAYPLWYPFDTSVSDGFYWLGFLYQPYAFYFLMSCFLCVDCLCVNIIIHLTSHVDILRFAFTMIDKNVHPSLNFAEIMQLKERRLVKCIKELQTIYRCAKTLNDIISLQLLFQMFCMALVICCSVYRVTSVTLGPEVVFLSSMAMICILETFNVTWFNHSFTCQVFELLQCVYKLDWINYPPKLRKMLVFLIMRLQKPFYFTMGFWLPLDLDVFLTTIKTSYSFYTLITQSGTQLTTTGRED